MSADNRQYSNLDSIVINNIETIVHLLMQIITDGADDFLLQRKNKIIYLYKVYSKFKKNVEILSLSWV